MSLSVAPPKAEVTGSSGGACSRTARARTSWHHLTAKAPFQLKFWDDPVRAHPSSQVNPVPELSGAEIHCKGKMGYVGESMKDVRCRMKGTDFESHRMSREMKAMGTKCRGAGEQPPRQGLLFLYGYIYRKPPHTKTPLFCRLGSPLWGLYHIAWEPVLPRHRNGLVMGSVSPPQVYPAPQARKRNPLGFVPKAPPAQPAGCALTGAQQC